MQQASPALTWLILITVGVLLLGAVIGWTVLRYQRHREGNRNGYGERTDAGHTHTGH